MTTAELLSKLEHVRRRGDCWTARCPAHEDRNPSLSIAEGRGGATLLTCHAGCSFSAIVNALGVEPSSLGSQNGSSRAKYDLEATYYYANADRSDRYRVQRKVNPSNPKDKQYPQHPSNGDGGWKTGPGCMEGIERILYRLPELLAADPTEAIFICEGEKCAEAVRDLGLVATCNSGGSGKFGMGGGPDYLDPLKDHPLVILADSDLPDPKRHNRRTGYEHSQDTAAKVKPIARSVKAFELPGVPADGGDVFDWIKAGGTRDQLLALADAAREWEAAPGESESEPWDLPAVFHEYDLPEFPTKALPPWLRDYVEGLARETQTPLDLPASLSLAVSAGAVAGRVCCQAREGWIEPLNLYTVTAMSPGNRKSAVFASACEPLEDAERELIEKEREAIAKAASEYRVLEQRLKNLETAAVKSGDPDDRKAKQEEAAAVAQQLAQTIVQVPPRLICADVTPEALASLIADQRGRMCLFSAEGELFDLMAGRYNNGSPNFEVILKSHSGDALRIDRRNRSEFVPNPSLTIGLTVQPDVIRGLVDKPGFRGRGLIGRFLYFIPRSLIGHREIAPKALSNAIRQEYRTRVQRLTRIEPIRDEDGNLVPRILHLSYEANQLLQEFERELEPKLADEGELGLMADWAGKLAGAVVRIASILSILSLASLDELKVVDEESMRDAIRIGKYLIPHAQAAYAEMGANPLIEKAKRLIRWIQKNEKATFTKRDAHRNHRQIFKTVNEMEPVLELLEAHDYIRARKNSLNSERPGRKASPVFETNPNLRSKGQNGQNGQNDSSVRSGGTREERTW